MPKLTLRRALLILLLSCPAAAQVISLMPSGDGFGNIAFQDAIQNTELGWNLFLIGSRNTHRPEVQNPSSSVSKLDLKAPGKAVREYERGYQLLMGNDAKGAVEHLAKSIAIYPKFVAAHNALGSAYLKLGQNEQARDEFAQAVALDDHLPNSFLNLGCAELALKQYSAAEESLRKASSIAPLDNQLQLALAYAEFQNHDYSAVVALAHQMHEHKHDGAALVHFFAAGASEAQGNLGQAQNEMEVLLQEDPKSPSAGQFHQILKQIKAQEAAEAEARLHPVRKVTVASITPRQPTAEEIARHAQLVSQEKKEASEIADAEAAPVLRGVDSRPVGADETPGASGVRGPFDEPGMDPTVRFQVTADEVSIIFAATDHGKSVTDLTASDVKLRDDGQAPGTILGFRNESQLPLRLGLIVDTSDSVNSRFSFEQAAASRFLQDVVVDEGDLAFVVGVNNSVLLVQDFTADQARSSHALNQLAPGGGTALWDAVAFAADKLAAHPETQPVARILVVISDGEDNSSSTTLRQAIARALQGEVAVYTISTRDNGLNQGDGAFVGDHALRSLSELTGGIALMPGSARQLEGSLADLKQVIRGRYLVTYKPASLQRDGRYRSVVIEAHKDGRTLKVFARKGYYASALAASSTDR